jgi:hypothetical protein
MQNLSIKSIIIHDNFTIDITLTNNKSFIFDIKPYLAGDGLKKLRQLPFFRQAKFTDDMLYWDDMHDFPLHCMDIPKRILKIAS